MRKSLLTLLSVLMILGALAQKKEYEKYLASGKTKFDEADYTGALIDFTQAINARTKEPGGHYWRGLTYYYLYKNDEAIKNYSNAIEVDDEYERAYFERGYLHLIENRYSEALIDFDRSTKLKSDDKTSWYNLGLCKYNLGDNLGAVIDYTKSLEIDPEYVVALYNRSIAKYYLGDYNSTILDSDKVIAIDPTYKNAYLYKGLCYYNQALYDKAIVSFDKVIELDPKYRNAHYNRGLANHYATNYTEAVKDFNKVIELDPTDSEAYYRRGLASYYLEAYDQSSQDYSRALELNPSFEAAKTELEFVSKYVGGGGSTTKISKVEEAKKRMPQIWAVVIGISEYADERLNLQYAHADAEDIHAFLTSPNGGGLDEDHVVLLTNEEATRANIIKALTDKFYRAFETDLVMLFIASHGSPDPVGNEVYFLTHDTDNQNLSGTGLSQIDIEKIFTRSRAGKKVWIADACHSGGAGLTVGTRGEAESAIINRLLFQMVLANDGMAMLTASSSSELSYENAKWGGGHGVFSHFFLEGIKGSADKNGNGIVEIRELYEYIYRNVSDETGGKQHPELKGNFDNELPLSIVRD